MSSYNCTSCNDTGVYETGNNDLPCSCPAGATAMFSGGQTGAEVRAELGMSGHITDALRLLTKMTTKTSSSDEREKILTWLRKKEKEAIADFPPATGGIPSPQHQWRWATAEAIGTIIKGIEEGLYLDKLVQGELPL